MRSGQGGESSIGTLPSTYTLEDVGQGVGPSSSQSQVNSGNEPASQKKAKKDQPANPPQEVDEEKRQKLQKYLQATR